MQKGFKISAKTNLNSEAEKHLHKEVEIIRAWKLKIICIWKQKRIVDWIQKKRFRNGSRGALVYAHKQKKKKSSMGFGQDEETDFG